MQVTISMSRIANGDVSMNRYDSGAGICLEFIPRY